MSDTVLLAHGSGGRLSHDLVRRYFCPAFDNPLLAEMNDAATFALSGADGDRLAFTTDSYVVSPIFFPGGDIGHLAVCGTVNDLATSGARPLYLSAAFVLEEGLPLADLERVVQSMRRSAEDAGVSIVTGDTKVVHRGAADRLFITTAGVGVIPAGVYIGGSNARPGDAIILSGTIGDHGIAVLSQREGLSFSSPVVSDCAPLNGLVSAMLEASVDVRVLRDPTRGGLATTLNEIAAQSGVGIIIEEAAIPVSDGVRGACEMLGFDPLYIANEGKMVAIVAAEAAEAVLSSMHDHPYGKQASIIGRVRAEHPGRVVMKTRLGTSRIVDMLSGELLPRIC
ncbi:MAG: hydrogenase expression/formation protein HypE [Chloroflexi bacterium]|nr:hydrogenase expression/formation protein HypE [Chloroflexota bacterium]MCL5026715.1 hydrogenase expression/formation protein HypE [Chloroflexota bacterium]